MDWSGAGGKMPDQLTRFHAQISATSALRKAFIPR
jgi:hypothetical protein